MIKRIFEGQPPHITFYQDFRQVVHGDLLPGKSVKIYYDADRLPQERPADEKTTDMCIEGYARFQDNGEAHPIGLWSKTGLTLSSSPDQSGAGTMLTAQLDLPQDAEALTLWFVNTGASGQKYYDSNYGKNYVLRFVTLDIHVHSTGIVSNPHTPYSGFNLSVYAAPHVDKVSVTMQVLNIRQGEPAFVDTTDLTRNGTVENGDWTIWLLSNHIVPYHAVVSFYIDYVVYGQTFRENNHERGYLAPPPEPGEE